MAYSPEDQAKLAHLLRRAGFGTRPKERAEFEKRGLTATTDYLLHPEREPDHLASLLEEIGGDYVDLDDLGSIRQWWLYRMVHTRRPLEEKMTLFWHNHFATANYKVDNPRRMWGQNELFRKYGLGSFRSLLQQVARDPAMLIWLDGAQNQAGKPNENFAREVMELFTLGVEGGYTEKDVQEAARAFTGWRRNAGGFVYDPFLHDDGEKTVLGQSGNWHADDVIDILARHPSTAKFVTTKLFRFFVHDNPPAAEINRLSQVYLNSGTDIRAVLQAIFTSPVFYSPAARFAKIKSPTEFAIMTIRALDAPMAAVRDLPGSLALMGQDLFNPPNVKGWQEGQAWINSRTLLARVNFAATLAGEMNRRVSLLDRLNQYSTTESAERPTLPRLPGAGNGAGMNGGMMGMDAPAMAAPAMDAPAMDMEKPAALSAPAGDWSAERIVDTLWDALLPGLPPVPATRETLLTYCREGDGKKNPAGRLPGVVNLIVSVPEYQLC